MKKDNDMEPVAKALAGSRADYQSPFLPGHPRRRAAKAVASLKDGEILLVQNTRYEKGEEKNDPALRKNGLPWPMCS
jgi:phosphoglycerate kinase